MNVWYIMIQSVITRKIFKVFCVQNFQVMSVRFFTHKDDFLVHLNESNEKSKTIHAQEYIINM